MSQEVERRSLGDGLPTVLGEEGVSPIQQIVDVLHHNCLFVGPDAQTGYGMGVEGIVVVGSDFLVVMQRFKQGLQPVIAEGTELPEASGKMVLGENFFFIERSIPDFDFSDFSREEVRGHSVVPFLTDTKAITELR